MLDRPTWAEIDLDAIAHNMRELRRIAKPEAKICAVVKANAYGHGAVPVSRKVLAAGADFLGVAVLSEALQLRRAGIDAPILILGYTPPEQAEEVVKYDLSQTVFQWEVARALSDAARRLGKKAKIHVKIDTGMGRIGFLPGEEAVAEIKKIAALPHLYLEGIFTHFAMADACDKTFTYRQLKIFLELIKRLEQEGIVFSFRHAANSAALIDLPETHLDMVRPGIALYGLYPSPEVKREKVELVPAMTVKSRIIQVKKVPTGTPVSYGCTWRAPRPTVVATLPIGYADGYTRLLSGKGEVLVKGKRVPVIGRICMDQCMIDVTDVPEVKQGEEVLIFGRDGRETLPVEELAAKIGTINYEIVCMLGERVPRYYREKN